MGGSLLDRMKKNSAYVKSLSTTQPTTPPTSTSMSSFYAYMEKERAREKGKEEKEVNDRSSVDLERKREEERQKEWRGVAEEVRLIASQSYQDSIDPLFKRWGVVAVEMGRKVEGKMEGGAILSTYY